MKSCSHTKLTFLSYCRYCACVCVCMCACVLRACVGAACFIEYLYYYCIAGNFQKRLLCSVVALPLSMWAKELTIPRPHPPTQFGCIPGGNTAMCCLGETLQCVAWGKHCIRELLQVPVPVYTLICINTQITRRTSCTTKELLWCACSDYTCFVSLCIVVHDRL